MNKVLITDKQSRIERRLAELSVSFLPDLINDVISMNRELTSLQGEPSLTQTQKDYHKFLDGQTKLANEIERAEINLERLERNQQQNVCLHFLQNKENHDHGMLLFYLCMTEGAVK